MSGVLHLLAMLLYWSWAASLVLFGLAGIFAGRRPHGDAGAQAEAIVRDHAATLKTDRVA